MAAGPARMSQRRYAEVVKIVRYPSKKHFIGFLQLN
jgi:hypothetical protein